jgi:hypothetical protein
LRFVKEPVLDEVFQPRPLIASHAWANKIDAEPAIDTIEITVQERTTRHPIGRTFGAVRQRRKRKPHETSRTSPPRLSMSDWRRRRRAIDAYHAAARARRRTPRRSRLRST